MGRTLTVGGILLISLQRRDIKGISQQRDIKGINIPLAILECQCFSLISVAVRNKTKNVIQAAYA